MNVGNQPPASSMPTGPSSSTPQHSADVDPNKLLLMLPDLAKQTKNLEKLAKTTEQTQDKQVGDSQEKAIIEFAKSLISQPDLPAGSKEALETWVAEIITQAATDTPEGAPTQQGQQTANAGTLPGTQTSAQTQAGTPAGTPQQGAQTTQAGTTQGQQTTSLGGDPNVLLTDDPSVSSAPVKNLGKMASTIASAQGGTLTQEQVDLLTKEASALFAATPSTLTEADKAVLLSFIGQLEEFPQTEDPNAPDSKSSTSKSSSTTSGSQTSQTRSAKAPDTSNLAMDELGLGDAVRELGQQAMSYVQGNGGKLGEKEAEQLKQAAEELIAAGADGDDLKALQNFIKALATFPKTAAGPADSPLLLTQPGIDPKMVTLSQYANAMMKAQSGTLTQPEMEMLKSMAQELMSQLSPEDQAILKTWLTTLGGIKTTIPPQVNVFTDSMLFGATHKGNPYMSPGIMAMLAPILGEILAINNDIIKQSSKLKQNMMKLLVAMANEAFKFAIAEGKAKANQLMNEAAMHMTLGISGCLQAGMAGVTFGLQRQQQGTFKKEAKAGQIDKKMDAWAKGDFDKKPPSKEILKGRQDFLDKVRSEPLPPKMKETDGPAHHADNITKRYGNLEGDQGSPPPDFKKQSFGEKAEVMGTVASRMQSSGTNALSQISGHLGGATDHFIQAGFKLQNVQNVLDESSARAYKDMISQLMQLVTGTIQSTTEEMQKAQQNFDSFVQLYKDFANTITQGIYSRQ